MKRILNMVLLAVLFFVGSVAHAKNDVEFHIQLSLSPTEDGKWCRSASAFLFRHSSHPDKNLYNRWFEKNRGIAFECAERASDYSRTIIGALPTSRDGNSLFLGKNVRFYTPEFRHLAPDITKALPFLGPLSVGVGAELVVMYYGFEDRIGYERALRHIPQELQQLAISKIGEARRGYIVAPVPNAIVSVRYKLSKKLGYLVAEQRYLAGNKAKLYSHGGWSIDY
jgi:hypothetical protein